VKLFVDLIAGKYRVEVVNDKGEVLRVYEDVALIVKGGQIIELRPYKYISVETFDVITLRDGSKIIHISEEG
jgi:hypothetical protein